MLWNHSRSGFFDSFGSLVKANCRQCIVDGPGVPSDQVPAKTMKTVTRSSGSSPAITGEPGRLAPQLSSSGHATQGDLIEQQLGLGWVSIGFPTARVRQIGRLGTICVNGCSCCTMTQPPRRNESI